MSKISIRLSDTDTQMFQKEADKQALTLSEYLRRLIKIGQKIEVLQNQNSEKDESTPFESLKFIGTKSCQLNLEVIYIAREILGRLVNDKDEKDRVCRIAHTRSKEVVHTLFPKE